MVSEGMNSTRNFVFVVLVATQGIIGEQTTLEPIEGQTDDVLGLTTLSNRRSDDGERTGSTKYTTNTTEEQTSRSDTIDSSGSYAYEAPTEFFPETTKMVRNSATTTEILEDLEPSDDKITTDASHHSPTTHTVEHSIRKDMSNNNEIEVSEKNASDKKNTNKTTDNATVDYRYVKLDTTTERPHRNPKETITMNHDESGIDDYVERTTDQHTEKDTPDFLKEDDDIDVTKFHRRMFEISHSFGDSNNKPEAVARTSTKIISQQDHSPLIHIEKNHRSYEVDSHPSLNEKTRQSYGNHPRLSHQAKSQQSHDVRRNYQNPVTPPYTVETNAYPDPYFNSRSGHFITAYSGQSSSFENERRFTQARPQFNNNQRLINNLPQVPLPELIQRPFEQLQPQLHQPTNPYQPQPQQLSMQLQYPWPTVQPVPNHMDNILASLQQASLYPVLSAQQYKDFYEKQYIHPRTYFN